ncbi:MAG: hypothetical protein IKD78_01855 [Bacteroidales bacterium]|nr:hypothetical protein [Bacteroidales bacterium]
MPDDYRQALASPTAATSKDIPYRKENTTTKRTPDTIPRPRTQAKRIASCLTIDIERPQGSSYGNHQQAVTNDIERPQGSSYGNHQHTLYRQAQEGARLRAVPIERPAAVTSRRSQQPQTARRTKEK